MRISFVNNFLFYSERSLHQLMNSRGYISYNSSFMHLSLAFGWFTYLKQLFIFTALILCTSSRLFLFLSTQLHANCSHFYFCQLSYRSFLFAHFTSLYPSRLTFFLSSQPTWPLSSCNQISRASKVMMWPNLSYFSFVI